MVLIHSSIAGEEVPGNVMLEAPSGKEANGLNFVCYALSREGKYHSVHINCNLMKMGAYIHYGTVPLDKLVFPM